MLLVLLLLPAAGALAAGIGAPPLRDLSPVLT